jgi:hypothetical protein
MLFKNFIDIKYCKDKIPDKPGLYCICVRQEKYLRKEFANELQGRGHKILYLGIATKSLKKRLGQELWALGHGTFFRSLGAVLGYLPPSGSLRKGNNYKFSKADETEVIKWINRHLELAWIERSEDLGDIEKECIKRQRPLLNLKHNPLKSRRLMGMRAKCLKIARGKVN